jgi:putative hemolysin
MSLLEQIMFLGLIALSAFMSASEIALFSLSRFQLRALKEQHRTGYRRIKALLGDPGGLLITILVVNELVNISISTLITLLVSRSQSGWLHSIEGRIPPWAIDTFLSVIFTTPILLFLCEATPKVIAARANQSIALLASGPLNSIYYLFRPVRRSLQWVLHILLLSLGLRKKGGNDSSLIEGERQGLLKESEFLLMLEEGHKEGAIQEGELELIRNVFALDDTPVSEITTPIAKAQMISDLTTVKGALTLLNLRKYSRIPVTTGPSREITGVLYTKDLLRAQTEPQLLSLPVSSLMKKPLFVSSDMRLNSLFRKFKALKSHMAIVQTPEKRIVGIVTMNDVLDELFEDIKPLFPEERSNKPKGNGKRKGKS